MQFPNYSHSLVNVSSSILNYFGVQSQHTPIKELVSILQHSYDNVILLLFDGMGAKALEYHLPETAFLRKHLKTSITSVFPPTTTAATTSVESGLSPIEHGWLGWTVFFPTLNKNINIFPNTEQDTNIQAASFNVGKKIIPYESIYAKIQKNGYDAWSISRFGSHVVKNQAQMYDTLFNLAQKHGKKYLYGYHEDPDHTMHLTGTYGFATKHKIHKINRSVKKFYDRLKSNSRTSNTVLIITADHGHIPIKNTILEEYTDIYTMLVRPPSIEPRAINFFIKQDCIKDFPRVFSTHFNTVLAGDIWKENSENVFLHNTAPAIPQNTDFILFTKQQVLSMGLFGCGKAHESTQHSLGDYLVVACGNICLVNSKKSHQFKSHHAGLTEEEITVPLIIIP